MCMYISLFRFLGNLLELLICSNEKFGHVVLKIKFNSIKLNSLKQCSSVLGLHANKIRQKSEKVPGYTE